MGNTQPQPVLMAVPKGRILKELFPLLQRAGITPEAEFFDEHSRKLQFSTNHADFSFIRVRSFDVATFVGFGAAQLGVCGSDVLMEFDLPELYAPLDLGIGNCRLSLAVPKENVGDTRWKQASHMRVATKYPHITTRFFAEQGIQAECIKLSGAMELAPKLGLAPCIVDLVSSGATLRANDLAEAEVIAQVSSRLIVNRTAYKTQGQTLGAWIQRLKEAADGLAA